MLNSQYGEETQADSCAAGNIEYYIYSTVIPSSLLSYSESISTDQT